MPLPLSAAKGGRSLRAIALAAAVSLCAPSLAAQEASRLPPSLQPLLRSDNPVVGLVGSSEIRWNDVIRSASRLPQEQQAQVMPLFPILLARLVDRQLLADAARQLGYARRPEVREALRDYENDLIRDAYVEDYLTGQVTAQALEARVQALSDGNRATDARNRRALRDELSRLALDRLLTQLRERTAVRLYPPR
ncbi:MAG: hypothetical protein Kilf2KO_07850 [Rhodospirillales bacterium]